VRENRLPDALAALLAGWQHEPSPELRALIERLSQLVSREPPSELRGRSAAAREAWAKLAARATVGDVPALVATLVEVSSGDAAKRLAFVTEWMPDPRIDAVLAGWLESVPYRATMTRPFWRKAFATMREIRDPAVVPRLESADARITASVAPSMAAWLRSELAKLRDALKHKVVHGPPSPILAEIANALAAREAAAAAHPRADLDALLADVYADPDDDGARLVYADALLERGDPRGELITLQCRLAREPELPGARELRRRISELVDSYGKQWLGELAPVVRAGYRFERGFLAVCRVDIARADRVRAVVGHPAWSTVRDFGGSTPIALHPIMRSLRTLAFDAGDAAHREKLPDAWRDLLVTTTRRLHELRYAGVTATRSWRSTWWESPATPGRLVDVPNNAELGALCTCPALPELESLVVVAQPELVAPPLLAAPVLSRLSALGFVFETAHDRGPPLRWFAEALLAAPVATLSFEIGHSSFHPTELRLERGSSGYERVALHVGPTSRSNWSEALVNEAIALLDAMPKTMRHLHITARRQTEPRQLARLRAAAEQLALDTCQID